MLIHTKGDSNKDLLFLASRMPLRQIRLNVSRQARDTVAALGVGVCSRSMNGARSYSGQYFVTSARRDYQNYIVP